jgi:hypothetical protein
MKGYVVEKGSVWALVAILGCIFIVIVGFMAARIVFGGAEDSWTCSDGQWVRHGNPTSAMPIMGCK